MTGGVDAVNRRHGQLTAVAGLAGVSLLAWVYLWIDAGRMASMSADGGMAMADMAARPPWSAGIFLLTFIMWSVMMVGMMLPSATPAILLYSSMARKDRAGGPVLPVTWVFTAGYLAVWTAFSLAATLLHGLLQALWLLTPAMASASAAFSGSLLVIAGVYQWLPVKDACLRNCRSPLQFFLFHWRPGVAGAFRMGAEHGAICLGCCWALMLLLFTAGVMNLLWVALIAAFVFVEKLARHGRLAGRLAGVALVVVGAGLMLGQG
ncbi:hypothetical protein KBTX_03856 [wastewater metagenome]|uniref:Metal-binding integral membrane protein n=2 Tax=unclassified sequences TaxID=12908 RepID=A0A5B8RF60_9ZZZZ|nr:DUF2182 domain-containing protein [Arhodomonas sp. KWT]QEA07500.1 hypothetical protein KBTEX_03856 [uncultured organism]